MLSEKINTLNTKTCAWHLAVSRRVLCRWR